MMKRINIFLLILFVGVLGCDVLNQEPQTAISDEFAIRDLASANAALMGLYDQLQSNNYYGANFQVITDAASDITQSIGTWDFYREIDTYVTNRGNDEVRRLWTQMYSTINHANNIIHGVEELNDITPAEKNILLGESYFIRALTYFDLTRTFGGIIGESGTLGVPIVTEPSREINDASFPSRASLADSWQQVRSDLEKAGSLLSGFDKPGRVSEAAVKALLSRYYLYMKDYDQAASYATQVIDDYNFVLTPSYADIFAAENTSGSIFELQYTTTDDNSLRFWHVTSGMGGRQDLVYHTHFAEMMMARPDDERGTLVYWDNTAGVWIPIKYNKSGSDDNIQILRLAEMYLNRAEAKVYKPSPTAQDLSDALDDLNMIRNRAGLADTTGAGVATAEQIQMAIEKERGIEFTLEAQRWFDLIRTGRAMTVLVDVPRHDGSKVTLSDAGRMVLPIPQRDMDANPNLAGQQNEAYK